MHPGQPQAPNDPSISSGDVLQVLEAGTPTGLIIESTRNFDLGMEFQLAGTMAAGLVGAPLTFTVRYYYDEMGGPNEGSLGSVTKTTQAGQLTYNATTPAGSETALQVLAGALTPGTYRLNGVVSFKFGAADLQLYAFTDGPVIQVV
jgi:hypothetical protein